MGIEFDKRLCKAVSKYEALYNRQHQMHNDPESCASLWLDVAHSCGKKTTAKQCEQRWNNIVKDYTRHMKAPGGHTNSFQKAPQNLMKEMSFIDPYVQGAKRISVHRYSTRSSVAQLSITTHESDIPATEVETRAPGRHTSPAVDILSTFSKGRDCSRVDEAQTQTLRESPIGSFNNSSGHQVQSKYEIAQTGDQDIEGGEAILETPLEENPKSMRDATTNTETVEVREPAVQPTEEPDPHIEMIKFLAMDMDPRQEMNFRLKAMQCIVRQYITKPAEPVREPPKKGVITPQILMGIRQLCEVIQGGDRRNEPSTKASPIISDSTTQEKPRGEISNVQADGPFLMPRIKRELTPNYDAVEEELRRIFGEPNNQEH